MQPVESSGCLVEINLILSISLYTIFSKKFDFFESVAIFTERSGVNIATDSVE